MCQICETKDSFTSSSPIEMFACSERSGRRRRGKRIKKKRKKERDPLLIQLLLLLVGEEKVLSFFKQVFEGERGGAVVILRGYKYI